MNDKHADGLGFNCLDFELDVRKILTKPTGIITAEDVLTITELICGRYDFNSEDLDVLCLFRNLETLSLDVQNTSQEFLSHFPNLNKLEINLPYSCNQIDFSVFENLTHLESLSVSCRDISSMNLIHPECLVGLTHLTELRLHEFGAIDLCFLKKMPWLTNFYCGFANHVSNIEAIGSLSQLKSLELVGIEMDNLDFLKELPNSTALDLCGCEVHGGIDMAELSRFKEHEICEMTVNGIWV